MDIGLPDSDGYTVAKGMRQIEQHSEHNFDLRAVICALTSHTLEEAGEQALASGMNVFVQKPFNVEIMQEIIEMASQVAVRHSHLR